MRQIYIFRKNVEGREKYNKIVKAKLVAVLEY